VVACERTGHAELLNYLTEHKLLEAPENMEPETYTPEAPRTERIRTVPRLQPPISSRLASMTDATNPHLDNRGGAAQGCVCSDCAEQRRSYDMGRSPSQLTMDADRRRIIARAQTREG
jgi:hypothetical protein